uniref:Uncharacterized protein n=1 Tax=Oryza rufipogon TaxID=4529 RepID=A0A0E0MWG4_ORYRU
MLLLPGPVVPPSLSTLVLPHTSSASSYATVAASTSSDNTTASSSFSVEDYLVNRCNLYLNVSCHTGALHHQGRAELGWTEAQVKTAAAKIPTVLMLSVERLRKNWEFLTKEVGMDAERVANFPVMLS